MRKYLTEIIIVVVVLLAVAVIVAMSLSLKATPTAIDDADLRVRPVRAVIAPEENAFTYFSRATNVMYYPKDFSSVYYGVSTNQDLVWATNGTRLVQIIASNEAAFAEVEKGLACSKCQLPERTNIEVRSWSYVHIRNLCQFLSVKADWLARNGRVADALEFTMRTVRLGQMIQNAAENMVDVMIASGVKNIGFAQMETMLNSCVIPSADLKRIARDLSSSTYRCNDESLKSCLLTEYSFQANLLDDVSSGKRQWTDMLGFRDDIHLPFGSYTLNVGKTKSRLAKQARDAIRIIPLSYSEMHIKKDSDYESLTFRKLLRPNAIGNYIVDNTAISNARLFGQNCLNDVNRKAIGLLAALKAFKQDNSRLPQSLTELVPEYIDGVPADPFDGKPIRYLAEKKIIYSVGKDLVDSGGSEKTKERWQSSDPVAMRSYSEDIVYRIEF